MKRILYAAVGFSFFATTSAFAGGGYITGNVYLRAGPDTSYPSVTILQSGSPVAIEGCVDGWSWCDVSYGSDRGWVAGNYIQEEYQGQRVLVPAYGVQIGIPIVSFSFGPYWQDHYRNRSWYGNRERWSRFTPQYRPIENAHYGEHGYSHENYGNTHVESHTARTDFHANDRQRQSAPVVTQSSYRGRANVDASQYRPVATTRPAERYEGAKPVTHNVQNHAAPARAQVVETHAIQPRTVAQHKAVESKNATEKSSHEHDNGKDKDQH